MTIEGVPGARRFLVDAPPHWPQIALTVSDAPQPAPPTESVDDAKGVLHLKSGGWVTVDRAAHTATFTLPARPTDGALVHPHLASVGVVRAYWDGRESFHAGAFVAGDGVWGVLGDREAGKSSLLASLALRGVPVLCDDLLVVDANTALAGPRSIDLRAGAADRLGCGEPLGVVGNRERWRLRLEPVAAELPLRGWVELGWGETDTMTAKRGADRLLALAPHRGLRLPPPRPESLLALAALPMYELRRRARWDSHESSIDMLIDVVAAARQPGGLRERE